MSTNRVRATLFLEHNSFSLYLPLARFCCSCCCIHTPHHMWSFMFSYCGFCPILRTRWTSFIHCSRFALASIHSHNLNTATIWCNFTYRYWVLVVRTIHGIALKSAKFPIESTFCVNHYNNFQTKCAELPRNESIKKKKTRTESKLKRRPPRNTVSIELSPR